MKEITSVTQRILENFARNLDAQAKAKGISFQELAEQSGVSRGTVYRIKDLDANLTLDVIARLAAALGMDPVEMLAKELKK